MSDMTTDAFNDIWEIEQHLRAALARESELPTDITPGLQRAWQRCCHRIADIGSEYDLIDDDEIPQEMKDYLQKSDPNFYGEPGGKFYFKGKED